MFFLFIIACAICCQNMAFGELAPGEYTIVCFGDSTTAPRPSQNVVVYASNMETELPMAGIRGIVLNKGIGRNNTDNAIARFEADVLAQSPDIVIIQFGINDSWVDNGLPEGASRVPLADYSANLTAIVRQLRVWSEDVRPILMTPNPIGSKYEKWRYDRLQMYAHVCRDVAALENIEIVDVWQLFLDYDAVEQQGMDSLFTDGMHPNTVGQRIVTDGIYETLGVFIPPANLNQAAVLAFHWLYN